MGHELTVLIQMPHLCHLNIIDSLGSGGAAVGVAMGTDRPVTSEALPPAVTNAASLPATLVPLVESASTTVEDTRRGAKFKCVCRTCFFDTTVIDDGREVRVQQLTKADGTGLLVAPVIWNFFAQAQPANCSEATKGMAFVLDDVDVTSPFGTCVMREMARGWRRVAFDMTRSS
jgi:hypothetical protein